MTIRVVINGFGRIGRTVLRQLLTGAQHSDIEVVAINDIAPPETCAYLFKYDSVYGPFPGQVHLSGDVLTAGDHAVPVWTHTDLAKVDLTGVDVVLECTGRAVTRDVAEAGLTAGADAVLISGPSPVADVTVVMGANERELGQHRIVSNASCTTNAIAPLMRAVDLGLGIERAHITTIHCYTGSQPTVDVPGPSLERSRAAAVSMIPTTTSAAHQITQVLPEFQDRLTVSAVRVPSLSVSAVDAVIQLSGVRDEPLGDFIQNLFRDDPVIGVTEDPCVSTDMRARPESLILATRETQILGQNQLRLFGWYDNEWGFSARMIDMTRHMAARA
ncbi:type I glyceraldehyde-3-phosphate dehydrogenase [Pseudooctadecabacter jejudonensis]|uniref:D-erythrose-4-phosphate dehydrogenase n=1 Tax=Pseudooctadecabacter jejudonensis TaxID=1391910 RepID=A0A1Y5RCM4_9RHOB|nr:glyceraldehyde 3-phosphate dehydrogenase NAD-binding domain-containing protein [Pseudooctadecabacter jejudonensis]SLN13509.1 D-erythrose-4-phosphate dehydrogenase [Pseudooctadecabacter jejudonensis]